MADVRLEIGGHDYHISCRDGDESNLIALGAQVNERVQRAKSVVRNATVAEQLVMAAILLARKLARGAALPSGASPCMGWLTLDEFGPEFNRWGMETDLVEEPVGQGA